MRNRGRKWKRDHRDLSILWRRKSELEGPWASEGVGAECRTEAVKRMQKKAKPQVPFLHGPTVGDRENKSRKRKRPN